MKRLLALSLALMVSSVLVQASEAWNTNYQEALAQAKSQKELVLLNFTGSDWCPPCMMMERQTLSQKAFLDGVEGKVVLVTLDFPQRKPQSESLQFQNEKLQRQYNIEGFPSFILLNSDGKELARHVGFLPGGPEAMLTWIKESSKGS